MTLDSKLSIRHYKGPPLIKFIVNRNTTDYLIHGKLFTNTVGHSSNQEQLVFSITFLDPELAQ